MSSHIKSYLGDGVYIDYGDERGDVVLTTENGVSTTNEIYLEYAVVEAFIRWLEIYTDTLDSSTHAAGGGNSEG